LFWCQRRDFFNRPQMIAYSCFHCGRASERLADAREVVVHEVKRDRVLVVFEFLAVRVGQSRKSSHAHPHREMNQARDEWIGYVRAAFDSAILSLKTELGQRR
jgi:hypothetical protein